MANVDDGRGLYTIVFRDNTVTLVDARVIVTPHGQLQGVSRKLAENYSSNLISTRQDCAEYLISGVLIRTNSIHSPPDDDFPIDEITFQGEVKKTLELLASDFKLPEIPEKSFMTMFDVPHYV